MTKQKTDTKQQQQSAERSSDYHTPVMLREAIDGLAIVPNGIYVDCTFGGGGHSRAILNQLGPQGKLVAFDQDPDAQRNLPADERLLFIPQNFRHLQRFLRLQKINQVDGLLADLGVSSHQFDEAGRGFSTRFNADLDMRMDTRQEKTAATILNTYSESALHLLFEKYGEVTNARTLARTLVEQRQRAPFQTIEAFKQALYDTVKGNPQKYLARVFQALRIEVNDELTALQEMLQQIPLILKPGGRTVLITFHSLEDRLVKNYFRNGHFGETANADVFGNRPESPFILITKKPMSASNTEIQRNPRSRSAKLRIAERKKENDA